ncbi:MAG: pseudouridine synthase [Chitinophagaceae bacterium]
MFKYFVIHKPFQVLSQFSSPDVRNAEKQIKRTLKDYFQVPRDVYPVGRLDYDSEGLLVLTNDTALNHRLLNPSFAHRREYWVQIEGVIDDAALQELRSGIEINIDGNLYQCKKCLVDRFDPGPHVLPRTPPVRFRKMIPTSWIKLVITEGKNRQVRRMTAKVGFPTLRLIRYRIEGLTLNGLRSGDMSELEKRTIYHSLFGE